MRRVGRSGTGWLGVEGLQDEVTEHLWSIARRAAQDAGRDPDALKTAMRINLEPGTSVDSVAGKLERLAGSGADEAIVDAFAMFDSLDQLLAGQLIDRWSDRGKLDGTVAGNGMAWSSPAEPMVDVIEHR